MATASKTSVGRVEEILGKDADDLLGHRCETVSADLLHLPGPDFVDRVWTLADRPTRVLRSLETLLGHGRLAGTGYVSILPVDQGIEHSAGASFSPNPMYFDGENIVKLAIEGGCNAVASTFGVLGSVARKYAHKIPFIVKLNHNQLLSYPNEYEQIMFGNVEEAWEMGAVAVGATIYFGSEQSSRQLVEVAQAFHEAHQLGLATVLWCYLRNPAFTVDGTNYELAADLTAQANHLGVTIEADMRSVVRRCGPQGGGAHGGDQQAGRGHGPDLRAQGLPAPDEGRRRAPQRDPGRLPGQAHHGRLSTCTSRFSAAGRRSRVSATTGRWWWTAASCSTGGRRCCPTCTGWASTPAPSSSSSSAIFTATTCWGCRPSRSTTRSPRRRR